MTQTTIEYHSIKTLKQLIEVIESKNTVLHLKSKDQSSISSISKRDIFLVPERRVLKNLRQGLYVYSNC